MPAVIRHDGYEVHDLDFRAGRPNVWVHVELDPVDLYTSPAPSMNDETLHRKCLHPGVRVVNTETGQSAVLYVSPGCQHVGRRYIPGFQLLPVTTQTVQAALDGHRL